MTTTPYQPIDCQLYDYLEIACMDAYDIQVTLREGQTVRGKASTTETRKDGEYLIINTASGTESVRLDQLMTLDVESEARRFDSVSFLDKGQIDQ